MKFKISLLALSVASVAMAALPKITDVTYSQDTVGKVSISYKLSQANAIVTMDVLTNGVSIGEEHITSLLGDVNRVVTAGDVTHKITWYPQIDWFNNKVDKNCEIVLKPWTLGAPPDIMVVELVTGNVKYYTSTNAVPGEGNVTGLKYKTDCMVFRRIPAAYTQWNMGSPSTEQGRGNNEDLHKVMLTSDYYMAIYECTQGQLVKFYSNLSRFVADRAARPAEYVKHLDLYGGSDTGNEFTGDDATDSSAIGVLRKRTGLRFNLPTEAQWEYACRAGTSTGLYTGEEISNNNLCGRVAKLARYTGNSDKSNTPDSPTLETGTDKGTAIVGSYLPNAWGLYDMLGNVSEKCLDRYTANLGTEEVTDPTGNTSATDFVTKGGCWRDPSQYCRAAYRGSAGWKDCYFSRGFRLCLKIGE